MIPAFLSALAEPARLLAIRMPDDGSEHGLCGGVRRPDALQNRMFRHSQVLKPASLIADRRAAELVRYRPDPVLPVSIRRLIDAARCEEFTA
jgi:hypothetical protein